MKASRFSDAQKAFILKQGAGGVLMADLCRRAGISQATYFNWKKKYDGMLPPEMRRLKQLEDENTKLRKLVTDLSLDSTHPMRIPGSSRPPFRFDPGRDSEMMPATIPSNSRPPGRE